MALGHSSAVALLCALSCSATTAWAQDPDPTSPAPSGASAPAPIPAESYAPAVVTVPDGADEAAYTWRRPSDVEFAFISGCGAGANGDQDIQSQFGFFGGRGGKSATYTTIIVGPLTADTYQVTVKRGNSTNATVIGTDLNVSFKGANGDEALSPTFPNASSGAQSIFGPGGDGGARGASGKDAVTACAGGGGAGPRDQVNSRPSGGRGGPGKVVIFPVPNMGRLFDVMGKLGVPKTSSESQAAPTTPTSASSG